MSSRSRFLSLLALAAAMLSGFSAWAQGNAPYAPDRVIIKFRSSTRTAERNAVLGDMRVKSRRALPLIRAEVVQLEGVRVEDALARYRDNPLVEYIEPDYEVHAFLVPNDTRFPEMYALRNTGQTGGTPGADIKATQAWDLFTGDPNLLVGVIDTGIDYNHPDLANNAWTNPGEVPGNGVDDDANGFVDDVHGYDFVNNDGDPFDDNGHGTHVSGTIAAEGNNNLGVVGVNWRAKIAGIKFLNASGSGSTSDAVLAVNYAVTIGCRLTSNSWGGGGFSQALLDAINAAGAAGQLFVAAAGNSGQNTDVTPSYPASYNTPFIISVAATDHNDNLASFSNYGATSVDLAAPGVDILSLQPGGGYRLLSGTSMATPHVSGAVALAWGRFPALTNMQVKDLVLNHVDVKASLQGRVLTNGRLNAFMTIAEPDTIPTGVISDLTTSDPGSNTMGLHWTATGDDGNTGRAVRYEIRYSTSPIDAGNFGSATPVPGPDPQPAGSAESFQVGGLAFSTLYYFAIKAFDEFNNTGGISNVATGTTLGAPDITASPTSFSASLLTGATQTQTLTLANDAAGTLDFTVPQPELLFTQPIVHDYVPLAKGQDDWRIGDPVVRGGGGPDGFGYRWVDSDSPNGPTFDWADITAVGTQLSLTGDDAMSAPVAMGISFPFYGASFTDVRVGTNGYLSFTDASAAYDNQPLPNAGAPANLVAPFWDDLDFGTTPRVYTYSDGSRFIVSWVGVPHYQSGGPYTFQAILHPTGEIRFQYLSLGSPVNSATLGIQNATKDIGLNVAFNNAYPHDNLAVKILPLRQWLTVAPASGRILAGQSMDLQVSFNALGLLGGNYDAQVHVFSNDPDEGELVLPASLHVIGAPDIAVSPGSIAYGSVFANGTYNATLTVSNPGTDDLVVSNITSGDPTLTAAPTSFTLAPLAAQNVTVSWHPTAPMTLNTTLDIQSNDPDSPSKTVAVTGEATPPPAFSVNPTSFAVSLLTNTATSRNLRVSNSGGSNFVFTAEALTFNATGTVVVHTDADNVFVDKGQPDVLQGETPLRSGGPDIFGYTYMDSDESGGPTFSWQDIRAVGTQIAMTGDDSNTGPFPIGFEFPFYGKTFNTFRVCTNGWVSFTSTRTTFSNVALPNSGSTVPENLLAVFWDDLHFDSVPHAYYHYDGTKLVIQYQDVRRLGESATTNPNTFEIILYPNGAIVYQYLSMRAANKASATIGMQNEAKNDGLQVVFNAPYVKDNLAIRFRPPARFLTVNPTSGTVPPSGFMDLTVGFNASGLFGGVYDGAVRIRGNDPVLPQLDVPARLTVTGVPDIAAVPASLDFGNVFIGFPQLLQLRINNVGTDVLNVTDIVSSHPAYGVDVTSFSVPPLGSAVVFVSFNPSASGPAPGQLSIQSNDPDTPALIVPLAGTGLVPPDISTTPSALSATLNIPDQTTQTLTVHNTGGSDLNFTVGTRLTATSVTVYDELDLGKEEPDPRPGILGSGGPDVFGYTWRDSDEPGGPVFDWVDITGIGTGITLPGTGDDVNVQGIPLGFSFPFYGSTFSTVNVCSNGWLSFTSTLTSLTNNPLPNAGSGVPENLLAVFWDDLDPDVSPIRLFHYRDGTRFILSYVGVPRFSSGGPYTFQVILYPSGRIVYQYLDMQGTRLNEATIGIQNATRDDGLTVVHNASYVHNNLAIEFRTTPDWLTVTPTSGTIPAGGSLPLQATLNSTDLFGGVYSGSVLLNSNDPDEGIFEVPATLTAVGVPDIAAVPSSLDFGAVYVGLTRDLTVQIRNEGNDVLNLASATIGAPYSLVGASFPVALGDRGTLNLTVRFTPTEACSPCAGDLAIASNDPDEPTLHVALAGVGVIPPEIGFTPASLAAALAPSLGPFATTATKALTIHNTGGSDLNWSAQALTQLPQSIETPSGESGKDDPGVVGALGSGGPDGFGYRWADSDDPIQGVPFAWVDITGVGTPIPFTGDDQNFGPFPLPFSFPFYGAAFDSFRACSNGWISFTSTRTTFTNTGLPNAATTTPENLIAAFWDDLTFSSTGDAYYHYDGEKMIISYVGVPRLGTGGGPYTFEIFLYPSGTIDIQYLDMQGTRLNEATVGIQNATKDIGLQVVFNAPYVKNNLRVRFTRKPGWLAVTPTSGVVPAGGQAELQVQFDATGLADGDYSGVLRVASNDLDEPLTDLACDLHVGVITADFDLHPSTLNRSSHGRWVEGEVELPPGYDARLIRRSSVLLEGVVPVAPDSPHECRDDNHNSREEAHFKFDRSDLLDVLPDGNSVPVHVTGEVTDITWFAGVDYIRVLRPRVRCGQGGYEGGPEGPVVYRSGETVPLTWDDAEGAVPSSYDVWYSADNGETWTPLITGLTERSYAWTVPQQPTEQGMLEVVAVDADGEMGSWLSDPFVVINGVTDAGRALPRDFDLRLAGRNPLPGAARFELAMPQAGHARVDVFDVRGARVRNLTRQDYEPGYHGLSWDGRDDAGSPVHSGIYFVKVQAGRFNRTLRLVMVR